MVNKIRKTRKQNKSSTAVRELPEKIWNSNPDEVEKAVIELLEKFYPRTKLGDISLMGTPDGLGDKGYFLFFLKRDETKERGRLSVYTLGANIGLEDIIEAFSAKIADMVDKSNKEIPVA